jgi:hypothetical protein
MRSIPVEIHSNHVNVGNMNQNVNMTHAVKAMLTIVYVNFFSLLNLKETPKFILRITLRVCLLKKVNNNKKLKAVEIMIIVNCRFSFARKWLLQNAV